MDTDAVPPASNLSVDELAAFLAKPIPRPVPPKIRDAALRQSIPISLAYAAALLGCFGLLIAGLVTPWNFLQDIRLNDAPTTQGIVEAATATSMSSAKKKVFRYRFSFQTPSTVGQPGECYTTGQQWSEGDAVTIRYLPTRPSVSRIEGARRSRMNSLGPLVTWIFPALGFGLATWIVTARRRITALLIRGTLAEARVTGIQKTETTINDLHVQDIKLEQTGLSPWTISNHRPVIVSFARDRLESQQPVYVLYDPKKPHRTLLPETLTFPEERAPGKRA